MKGVLKRRVVFGLLLSWSCLGAAASPTKHDVDWIEKEMQSYHIPGVSIAIIRDYKVKWVQGFGLRDKSKGLPVNADTLFQVGSLSKPVAALTAVKAFSEKHLSLDTDVGELLTSWKLPYLETSHPPVTMRKLLQHTAGVQPHRYVGYPEGTALPHLVDVLKGDKVTDTPPVVMEREQNDSFNYASPGYTVVQQVLEDVYRQHFDSVADNVLLKSLGMRNSTFSEPLPEKYRMNVAIPYLPDGKPVPGGAYHIVTSASNGLWSSASDLARFVVSVQKALRGKSLNGITPSMVQSMLKSGPDRNWGLGFELNLDHEGDPVKSGNYFGHSGFNTGYLALMMGSKIGGDGIVVLVNSAPYAKPPENVEVRQYEFVKKIVDRFVLNERVKNARILRSYYHFF